MLHSPGNFHGCQWNPSPARYAYSRRKSSAAVRAQPRPLTRSGCCYGGRADRACRLGMVARPGRELAITHGPQLPAQGLLGNGDAELLEDPLRQIDQPPSHHPVDSRDRASLDHPLNGSALDVIKLRGLARRLAVQKTVGASRIEAEHPIADDLKSHAPDLRCLAALCTVIDRRRACGPSFVFFANPR